MAAAREGEGQPLHRPRQGTSSSREQRPAGGQRDVGGVWAAPPGGEVIVPPRSQVAQGQSALPERVLWLLSCLLLS